MRNIEPTEYVNVYFHGAGTDPLGRLVGRILRWSPIGGFGRPHRFVHVSVRVNDAIWSLDDDRVRAYESIQEMQESGTGPSAQRTVRVPLTQIADFLEKLDENWESHRLSKLRCFWAWLGIRVPPKPGVYTICTDMVADLVLPGGFLPGGLRYSENWNLTPDELYAKLRP